MRDAASNARAASAEHGSASDRRTPRPWTFFGVAAGLLACRSSSHPAFPMRGRISDLTIGSNSLLTVAGAAPDSRRSHRDTPASLLATKSCDPVDRDGYMWCYSWEGVNGVEKTFARNFKKFLQTSRRGAAGPDSAVAWKRFSPISQDGALPVTSWHRAQSGIASRRFAAPGRSAERRAARNPDARRPCSPCRSALHSRS